MMSTNFLFIEWKWTMENADGFTQFKDRNFVIVWTLWNLYDTTTNSNMWKDRVNIELTVAVLDSYKQASVAIVDHHSLVSQN